MSKIWERGLPSFCTLSDYSKGKKKVIWDGGIAFISYSPKTGRFTATTHLTGIGVVKTGQGATIADAMAASLDKTMTRYRRAANEFFKLLGTEII